MSQLLWANNASSFLAVAAGPSATTLNLAGGTGVLFPSPGANQYFLGTISPAIPGAQPPEIVRVVARSSDALTVVRAREGTNSQSWGIGAIFQNLITRGTFEAVAQVETYAGNPNGNVAGAAATVTTPPSIVYDTFNGLFWACQVSGTASTTVWAAQAPLFSPNFAGDPTVPTKSPGDNSTNIASTAFVTAAAALKANLAGNSSQLFSVANATSNPHAVNLGQLTALIAGLLYPGMMMKYGGVTAPPGWLLCDGSLVSRSLYANLFAVISTRYGAGDGFSTFALPNHINRFSVGAGGAYPLGSYGGSSFTGDTALSQAQMPYHEHTGYTNFTGDHQHWSGVNDGGGGDYYGSSPPANRINNAYARYSLLAGLTSDNSHLTSVSGNHQHFVQTYGAGNSLGHNHTFVPFYVADNVIIKI